MAGGERWDSMDMAKANEECGERDAVFKSVCKKCDMAVMLHGPRCNIQVTGCTCTEVDRFGATAEGIAQVYERMAKSMGPERAKESLQRAGFWIPKGVDLN